MSRYRCHVCKGRHDTIPQVRACSAANQGQPMCRHDLPTGSCITCAHWNKRRGVTLHRSTHPGPGWITDLFEDGLASGQCALCEGPILVGEWIAVRKGWRNWAHWECFTDPGTAIEREPWKSQREPDAPFNPEYSRELRLTALAESLLAEAWAVESETTWSLLQCVAQDMDWELSIDLIRETMTGMSLDILGAWEPRETDLPTEEDMALITEMWSEYERYQLL